MGEVRIRVQARAKRNEIAGLRDGAVVVRVTAPPVDGKANAAVCKVVAKALGVPPTTVAVVRGMTSRDKVVAIDGVEAGDAVDRLVLRP